MRWNFKKQSRSTGKGTNSSFANKTLPSKTVTSSSKWYHSIYDLPLSKFIEAHVDGNLYALVISGKPTDEELLQAWGEINLQYADTMKNREYRAMAILNGEITSAEILYNQIMILIKALSDYYVDKFKVQLNRLLKTSYKLDVTNPEEYDNELKNATNRSKGIMLDIRLKKAELEGVKAKMPKVEDPGKEYFYSALLTLQNHNKYRMKIEDTTVFEFCESIRRMNEEFDQLKLATNGK